MPSSLGLTKFTGIRQDVDPAEIPDTACVTCQNITFDKGTIKTRPGRARLVGPSDSLTVGCRALFEYANGDDSPQVRLFGAYGNTLYCTDTAAQAFSSFLKLDTTIHATNKLCGAQFNDSFYFVDGNGAAKMANPLNEAAGLIPVTTITTLVSPTQTPGLSRSYAQYRLIDCRNGDADGQGYGFYDTGTIHQSEVSFPSALCAYSVAYNSDVDGACVRGVTATANVYTGQSGALALEIFDGTGGGSITGNVRFYRKLPEPRDLSLASSITVRHMAKAGGGDAYPDTLVICISEDGVTWTEYTVPSSAYVKDTWYTDTVDISATAAADRDAIQYVGFRMGGIETEGTTRLETTGSEYRPLETSVWTLVVDTLETDIVEDVFAQGSYDVTYTYSYLNAITGLYEESQPHSLDLNTYQQFTLNEADCIGLQIDTTLDAAGVSAGADYINIYIRGGLSPSWAQIASLPVAVAGIYSYTWDGQYTGEESILADEYSVGIPSGCSLLHADKGRMIYVGENPLVSSGFHDTIFVSNLEEPGRTVLQSMSKMSTTHGFFQAVGQDGAAVTGVASFGGNVLLFKAQGTWIFSGTDSNGFRIDQLSSEHGCVSHESIQQAEGLLTWLDVDHIWAWDGQTFTDIGKPVQPMLAAYTSTQKAGCFSVYDPAKRWLCFGFPSSATLTTTPAAEWLVYDFNDESWTRWTAMPGGCAIYAPRCATPGVYASDLYIAAGVTYLYRCHTGLTDATFGSTGAAIAWNWFGKHFEAPYPGYEKDVEELLVEVGAHGTGESLTLYVRSEGSASVQETASVAIAETQNGRGRCAWWPDTQYGNASVQLGIAGSTSAGCDVRGLAWTTARKGRAQ